MDCRRSVVLALALLTGALGCSLRKPSPLPPLPGPTDDMVPQRQLTSRQPKAKTCVAIGQLKESEAEAPQRAPNECEALREQALKAYQQALQLDPKNLQAAQALARLYSTRGDADKALATYQKALKAHPKEPAIWFEAGMCHARKKDWEPAIRSLRKAVELDPENRQCAHILGYTLACAGQYDESLACFQRTDGEAMAHFNLARMLHRMERFDLSRQQLQLALQKDPQLTAAQAMLAHYEGQAPETPEVVPTGYPIE